MDKEDMYTYWHKLLAYVAELESEPIHYFLMRGYEEFHDGDEWIGIYDSLAQLKSAYKASVQALERVQSSKDSTGSFRYVYV